MTIYHLKGNFWEKTEKIVFEIALTESQEEMRRLLDCGAKQILETASLMGFPNFRQAPFILMDIERDRPGVQN